MSDNTADEQASNVVTEAGANPLPTDASSESPPELSSVEPSVTENPAPPETPATTSGETPAAGSASENSEVHSADSLSEPPANEIAEPMSQQVAEPATEKPTEPAETEKAALDESLAPKATPSSASVEAVGGAPEKASQPLNHNSAPARPEPDSPPMQKDGHNGSIALLKEKKKSDKIDDEDGTEKLKYPRSVFFIVSNEFCERFSYYGMRTILVLYLTSILTYKEDDATVIYHVFTMFCYFFPLLGSMIADSWLGKFNTIFFLSIIYAIGNIVISFASSSGSIDIPGRELSIIGLLLIAFGTGGIKPCVSAFGGDQFKLPQQEKQMAQFFSLFYFAINSGSLLSTFLTPILREDVKCFDQTSCYPLAFGVPAVLMVISIIIFVAGKRLYIVKKPQGNVVAQVCKTMGHAIAEKFRSKGPKRDHWLDYADDKFEKKQIEDIKSALRVLFLYIPLPFFWALFDQQGSRWTFQATMMTGDLGGWSLKPDQMQVVNPLLILIFIPMFETIIYPLLKKCNLLTRPLQRLGTGGVLAALAFGISAIVELQVEKTYAVLPKSGEGQIRIFNGLNCESEIEFLNKIEKIEPYGVWFHQQGSINGDLGLTDTGSFKDCEGNTRPGQITFSEKKAKSYLISEELLRQISENDNLEKIQEKANIRIIYNNVNANEVFIGTKNFDYNGVFGESGMVDFTPNEYEVIIDGNVIGKVNLKVGGVYTLLISQPSTGYEMKLLEITPANKVHMLWLIPQYIVLTMGEIMFSITGLEFSYSQSPLSMKSVMQAGWLLTVAFGNLIVVIIAEAKFFDRQLWEFVLFGGLMLVDMVIFTLMAFGYTYIETPHEGQDDLALETTGKNGIENTNFHKDDEQ